MNEITYIEVQGSATICCRVRLDKKIIGAIYASPGGYYYRPTGSSQRGEQFKTIEAVKATL